MYWLKWHLTKDAAGALYTVGVKQEQRKEEDSGRDGWILSGATAARVTQVW